MQYELPILQDFVVILAAVIVIIPIFRALRIPALVGFLVAGVLIGPSGLQLIEAADNVRTLAEIGVVLLLFTIGLEFPLTQFQQIKRYFFVGGGLQIVFTVAIAAAVVGLLGFPTPLAILAGFLVSLSSTAIVMKILADRGETNAPHGKISIGVLIFQDLSFVPMMLLVPILAATGEDSVREVSIRFGLSLAAVAAIILGARYGMPRLLRWFVRLGSREVFVIGIVLISLGTAWLASLAGLSLALGAFVAGLVLSESEYSHQIFAEVIPMRDVLGSLFFVSIGMLFDVAHALQSLPLLVASTTGLIVLKFLVMTIVVFVLGFPIRVAVLSSLALAQVGEFSFILARAGLDSNLLSGNLHQTFIAVTIFTMLATPLLIQYGPRIADKVFELLPLLFPEEKIVEPEVRRRQEGHVVIVGYGVNGRNVATVLKETGIPYVIVDFDDVRVRRAREEGEPIVYGDGTRPAILRNVNVESARVLVVAFSDPESTRQVVRSARSLNKDLYIIVRTHYLDEMEQLYSVGANEVIPEEFETSIEVFTRVLHEYHVPRNVIAAQVDLLRRSHYGMMRGLKLPEVTMSQIESILAAGTTDTFLVLNESPACGKTLGELRLRSITGASVIAVVRKNVPITNPLADFRIESGDILVLIGTHAQIDAAFDALSPPPPTNYELTSSELS